MQPPEGAHQLHQEVLLLVVGQPQHAQGGVALSPGARSPEPHLKAVVIDVARLTHCRTEVTPLKFCSSAKVSCSVHIKPYSSVPPLPVWVREYSSVPPLPVWVREYSSVPPLPVWVREYSSVPPLPVWVREYSSVPPLPVWVREYSSVPPLPVWVREYSSVPPLPVWVAFSAAWLYSTSANLTRFAGLATATDLAVRTRRWNASASSSCSGLLRQRRTWLNWASSYKREYRGTE